MVDDDVEHRRMCKEGLEKEGVRVIEADNGAKGLESAVAHHPDLIVLDNKMPDTTGYEMLKILRERDNWGAHVPVIFFSNVEPKQSDEVEDVQALRPVEYIIKSKTELPVVVSKILHHLRTPAWDV